MFSSQKTIFRYVNSSVVQQMKRRVTDKSLWDKVKMEI